MQFYLSIISAQVQFSSIVPYAAVIISLIGAFVSVKTLSMRIKEHKKENAAMMASKVYVKEEISKVEVSHLNLANNFRQHQKDNEKDHQHITEETNVKLDLIIKLLS